MSDNQRHHQQPYRVDPNIEHAREWVLISIPEDPFEWIAETVRYEYDNGRHPGRIDGPLAYVAERLRTATRAGGSPTRWGVIQRWDDQRRLELFIEEILRLRPKVA